MSIDAGIRYVPPVAQANDASVAALIPGPSATRTAIDNLRFIQSAPSPAGGGTDDMGTLQTALNLLAASGGGTYLLRVGTYLISGELDIPANVTLRGVNINGTILQSRAGAATNPVVRLRGNYAGIEDLTVDVNARVNSIAIVVEPAAGTILQPTLRRVRIINGTNNAVRVTMLSNDFTMEDCIIDGCADGIGFLPPNGVTKDVRITGCTIINATAGHGVQLFGSATVTFSGVLISNNTVRDNVATIIPFEITYSNGVACTGNYINGGSRGFSTGHCTDIAVVGNTVLNQTAYFMETGASTGVVVSGNVAENCAQFVAETSAFNTDTTIVGNTINGSGLTGVTTLDVISFLGESVRIRVADNQFNDCQFTRSFVRFGGSAANPALDCVVEGNTFLINSVNTPVQCVLFRRALRGTVRANHVTITRALIAGDDITDVFAMTLDAASGFLAFHDNEIVYTGSVALATNHAAIGHGSTGAAVLPGVRVKRNDIIGGAHGTRLSAITSADIIVDGNDSRTCNSPTDGFNAAALFVRQTREVDGTAAPTTGAWIRGDHVRNSAQTVGSPKGWFCTVTGSPGTWVSEGNL